jgi:hypothetical protein
VKNGHFPFSSVNSQNDYVSRQHSVPKYTVSTCIFCALTPTVPDIFDEDVNNIKYNTGYSFYGRYWSRWFVLLSLLLVIEAIGIEVGLAPPKFVYLSCCYYELWEIKYEFSMAFNSIKFILYLIRILAVLKLKYAGQTDLPHAFILRTSCKERIIQNW